MPDNNPGGRCRRRSCIRRITVTNGTGTKLGSLRDQQNISSNRIFGQARLEVLFEVASDWSK